MFHKIRNRTCRLNILVFLFCFAQILQMNGQEIVAVEAGKKFYEGDGSISNFMDEDDDSYYFLKTNNRDCIELNTGQQPGIAIFDRELNLTRIIDINFNSTEKTRRLNPVTFLKTNSGYILLCSQYSAPKRSIKSFLFKINTDGNIVGDILHPGQIEDIPQSLAEFDFFDLGKLETDSAMHYVYTLTTPSLLDISERINFIVYDENLTVKSNRLLDYPNDFIDYNITKTLSFRSGLYFIHVEIFNPYEPKETIHQLVIYNIHLDDFDTYELKFDNGIVKKAELIRLRNNYFGLFGYYVKQKDSDVPVGVFYYIFDAGSGKLVKQEICNFEASEREMLNPRNLYSKSEYKYLEPQSMHLTKHNNVLLLFEYNWKSIMLIRDQEGHLYDQPYYYANEIFVFRFDVKDSLTSSGVVYKKQTLGHDPGIIGFHSFCADNSLYILFNDNPKNTNQFEPSKLKTMKGKSEMMLVDYNYLSGEYSKTIFNGKKNPFHFNPDDVIITEGNKMLFFDGGIKKRLVEVSLE